MSRTLNDMYKELGYKESTQNYKSPITDKNPNPSFKGNYLGRYQMGPAALEDAGYYIMSKEERDSEGELILWNGTFTGGEDKNVYSVQDYLNNPKAQDKAVRKYHKKTWDYLQGKLRNLGGSNIKNYLGKEINGIVVTPSGLLIASHLVGQGKVAEYLKSNGKPNSGNRNGESFFDGNGTHLEEYLSAFADYDVSETTGIPHKMWGLNSYLKNKGEDRYITEKEFKQYENFQNMPIKNNDCDVRNRANEVDKLNEKIKERIYSAYDGYLKEKEDYIKDKYKDCKNKGKKTPKMPFVKNITFEQYKKEQLNNTKTSNISSNNTKTPTQNSTIASSSKSDISPYEEIFRNLDRMFEHTKVTKDGKNLNDKEWEQFLSGLITGKITDNSKNSNNDRKTNKRMRSQGEGRVDETRPQPLNSRERQTCFCPCIN